MKNEFAVLPERLPEWFDRNARDLPWRENRDPYRVWVSEIMLQQTRVEAVRGYYARFLQAFPTVSDLANAQEDTLFKLWEGLGYYSRARNLHRAAKQIVSDFGGVFPERYADIRALPGIGDYTAGAIASICFEQPRAAVDGNVLRVTARFSADDTPVDDPSHKKKITALLEEVYPSGSCGKFTQSLMELGATVCTPRAPRCGECPLQDVCRGYRLGTAAALPVKKPKRDKKHVRKTVFLLWCGDRLALSRRAASGLLGGMWEFPNVDVPLDAEKALRMAEMFGVQPETLLSQVNRTHVFTHIVWEMTGYSVQCAVPDPRYTWKTLGEIRAETALPTAFRIFLEGEDDACAPIF